MNQHSALPYQSLPLVQCGQSFSLLDGVTILDLTTSVAGPYATMLLSDFGAEVIKIERPEGDDARQWGPPFLNGEALWFTAINRNKKSVVIDMRANQGAEAFKSLLLKADVVVTNQPLDVQRKLKLDYESLRGMRKDLIFVSITGFGLSGSRSDLTCYDLIAEGYSGIMDITGEGDSPPQKIGAPAADMLAGQDAAMATMAALFDRQRSGKGRKIEISLVESMTRFLACRISSYLGSGEVPQRSGGTDSVIAIYQAFDTVDSKITLGIGSDAIWARFWTAVGDPGYASTPHFKSNADRRVHREAIVEHIQAILLAKSRAEWLEIFANARIPAGPINQIDELTADVGMQERGMFFALQDGQDRIVPQIGLGIQIDDKTCIPRSSPPHLGEHTAEVLGRVQQPGNSVGRIATKFEQGA